jgi:hypothetical protein
MEELTKLIDKELMLENVDQATKDKVISELGEIIMERALTVLLAKDEDSAMEKLIDEGKLGEAFEYAEQNFPYLGEILEATANEVILEYKSTA